MIQTTMNKEKKQIGDHNISPLVDELLLISAKTFSYIGGVYVYCRKHDLDTDDVADAVFDYFPN